MQRLTCEECDFMVYEKPTSIKNIPGVVTYMFERVTNEILIFPAVKNMILFFTGGKNRIWEE